MANTLNASQAQRERLAFLELRAFFTGELRRSDIEARFGIKPAASSRDLGLYREIAPDNLECDTASRCYRPSGSFQPVFEFNPDRVLAWLRNRQTLYGVESAALATGYREARHTAA